VFPPSCGDASTFTPSIFIALLQRIPVDAALGLRDQLAHLPNIVGLKLDGQLGHFRFNSVKLDHGFCGPADSKEKGPLRRPSNFRQGFAANPA
jgi:hypothetical protein